MRSALGASRARIIGQLFVEALVLASVAAAVGLIAADRTLTWGIESVNRASGGAPFWMTPGLKLSTILYAGGLAVVSAAMLSLLPALKVTRARLQPHLANLGSGGATLRFGRVWTGAMIVQVALTAIGIPVALESVEPGDAQAANPRDSFQVGSISPLASMWTGRSRRRPRRRSRSGGRGRSRRSQRRIAQEPGVVAVTFADRAPGSGSRARTRRGRVLAPAPSRRTTVDFATSAVGPGFFEAFDRPIVAGRGFHGGDLSPAARTVIVNEAFVREFSRRRGKRIADRRSPPVCRVDPRRPPRRPAGGPWFEIVGVVRDLGLDPDDEGNEQPYVFHAASAGTVSPLVMSVRMRGNPATLAARLPVIAAACRCAIARPGGAAAGRMDPAAG